MGHAMRIKRIAASLSRRGVRCVVASSRKALLNGFSTETLQAPQERKGKDLPPPLNRSFTPRDLSNFTSLMWELCFWRRTAVLQNLQGWDKIFSSIKPDAIVADLAPFALLAAAGRIPTAAVGNGYFVPACVDGYLTPDGLPASNADKTVQAQYFANIKWAYKKSKLEPPSSVAAALCGDVQYPATLPALDPRYSLRTAALVPPEMDALPPLILSRGQDVYIYMGEDPQGHKRAIEAVATVVPHAVLYASQDAQKHMDGTWPSNLEIRLAPFTPEEISIRAALVVHHGGAGITHLAALSGVPQLIAYRGHERWHNATAIWKKGAGAGFPIDGFDAPTFSEHASQFAAPSPQREASLAWARESQDWIRGRLGQDVIAAGVLRAVPEKCDAVFG